MTARHEQFFFCFIAGTRFSLLVVARRWWQLAASLETINNETAWCFFIVWKREKRLSSHGGSDHEKDIGIESSFGNNYEELDFS